MKIIAKKHYSYILFERNEDWVLTLLIGGVAEEDVSVLLTSEEIEAVKSDLGSIEKIVHEVKFNRSSFSHREIVPAIWPSG